MMWTSLGIGGAFVEVMGEAAMDFVGLTAGPARLVDIPARPLRRALLTFRSSIQGRIPEILGDDEEERIETLVVLLDGTSEEELNMLLTAASEALSRLEADKRLQSARRSRSTRRRSDRRRSAA
jgi:hypothetical protein